MWAGTAKNKSENPNANPNAPLWFGRKTVAPKDGDSGGSGCSCVEGEGASCIRMFTAFWPRQKWWGANGWVRVVTNVLTQKLPPQNGQTHFECSIPTLEDDLQLTFIIAHSDYLSTRPNLHPTRSRGPWICGGDICSWMGGQKPMTMILFCWTPFSLPSTGQFCWNMIYFPDLNQL